MILKEEFYTFYDPLTTNFLKIYFVILKRMLQNYKINLHGMFSDQWLQLVDQQLTDLKTLSQ